MEYSSLKKDKQAGKALEQVRQVLLQVLPDITDIRISSKGHQQFLELESPYGWVRLREMSLGYQTLVVWLTDFASKLFLRYPDSPNPLEEPAIVLIDEIDLHLHPSWQRKLLGFLSGIFKNTQFIATAHSPLVVQAAGDEGANVVLLRREGDQTVVVTDVEDVRGWRVDQILTSSFYNLETARSLETEKKLERQAALLNKKKLTAKDRQELDALTLELEGQPMGSAGAEAEEEALLRQIAERLGTGTDK
ncbi:AAA family ATPase [Hymenobacter rubripertinctus]|nr:AAA family ATPase [Hymenobacter rubripertinctus]